MLALLWITHHDRHNVRLARHHRQSGGIEHAPTFWTGDTPQGATIQQVWFAGAHSDVGGGYNTRTLSDIPLVWMAKQVEAAGLR